MPMPELSFVCPQCKATVQREGEAYVCAPCSRIYPVLFGIADFRLRGDRYLSLEQERVKARRLYEYNLSHSFEQTVAHYYSITDDVPSALSKRYQAYIRNGPKQAQNSVISLGLNAETSVVLDAGCGTGGFLIAASKHCRRLVGVDIALRWLVICNKQLEEQCVEATLVCADIESPPFATGSFTHIVAGDLLEHVYNVEHAVAVIAGQLAPGGKLWISASNRYCVGPQASTRIWGIGFLPQVLRSSLLLKIRGVDSLRFFNLLAPFQLLRVCRSLGFGVRILRPRQILAATTDYPWQDRVLITCFRIASRLWLVRYLLVLIGPAFEMLGVLGSDEVSSPRSPTTSDTH